MINLFIIDDDHLIGSGFEREFGFESDNVRVCGCAKSIEPALKEIPKLSVNLIVLDLYLGHLDPVENVHLLKKVVPHIPIVILTHEEDRDWKTRMFQEGVSAYLIKSPDTEDMIWTFRKVSKGEKIIPEEILNQLAHSSSPIKAKLYLLPSEIEITEKLKHGHTVTEIANRLHKTPSSIEKALHAIREKFGARTNCELIAKLTSLKML